MKIGTVTMAKPYLRILLLQILLSLSMVSVHGQSNSDGHCIWYDECYLAGSSSKNYVYNCTALPLDDEEAEDIMLELCPHIYKSRTDLLCCSPVQVRKISSNFEQAEGIFGRCNSCMKNMIKSICSVSCAADHSRYVTPTEILTNWDGSEYINSVEIVLDESYANNTYYSCSTVIHPASGRLSMDVACSGIYNSKTCAPERWYHFLGDVSNPLVPFEMVYKFSQTDENRFIEETKPCYEVYEGDFPCSCIDCARSCPIGEPPVDHSAQQTIGGLNIATFSIGIVLGGLGVAAVLVKTCLLKSGERVLPQTVGGFNGINLFYAHCFKKWGIMCAENPILVLATFSWIIAGLAFGIQNLIIITDPADLWASSTSEARIEKDYFDSRFGPVYRTNQIFIKPTNTQHIEYEINSDVHTFGPAFNYEFLLEVFRLQRDIQNLGQDEGAGLENICYTPLLPTDTKPQIKDCVVQSLFGYCQNSFEMFSLNYSYNGINFNYLNTMDECINNPYDTNNCLALYGGPIEPKIALGGYPLPDEGELPDYRLATGVILTFLVNNKLNKTELEPALEWERKFVDFLKNYSSPEMEFAFSAERSIEDGIEEISQAEIPTVVVSYVVMFIYIAVALGKIRSCRYLMVETKITLATGGIFVVLASVGCSLGFFGCLGISTTMLTIEVIPFLVLAVGVDNIFMLVHAFDRIDRMKYSNSSERIGETLGTIGPSILPTSLSECCCFGIGSLSNMLAVKTFALYSAVAIFLNFIFQVTVFVALMSLDQKRFEQNRFDLLWCVKVHRSDKLDGSSNSILHYLFENYYTSFILSKTMRPIVLITFIVITSLSIMVIPSIEPGLDQQLSMAKDSHVVKYFQFMAEMLRSGAPVYWVLGSGVSYYNVTKQNVICGGTGCNQDSLSTQLTRIATPPNSWIDDYIDWLSIGSCCKMFPDGTFCLSSEQVDNRGDCLPRGEMDLNIVIKSELAEANVDPMEHIEIKTEIIGYDEIQIKQETDIEAEMVHHQKIEIKHEDPIDLGFDYLDNNILNDSQIKTEDTEILAGEMAHECYICKLSVQDVTELQSHMDTHSNPIQSVDSRTCTICSKRCISTSDLKRHMAHHSEERNIACELCPKMFKTNDCLKQHMRKHSDIKRFECPECALKLKSRNGLKNHLLIHSGEKPFGCEICSFKCTTSGRLLYHTRSYHTGEKVFSCKICSKRFITSRNLQLHFRLHTGKKPYACDLCPSKFHQKPALDRHKLTHEEYRQWFECNICSKKLATKMSLKRHVEIHTGEGKRYKCNLCPYETRHHSSRRTHMKAHERNGSDWKGKEKQ